MRLDNYLVENDYFDTRNKAQIAIKNNNVFVNNKCINKNSYIVNSNDEVKIVGEVLKYVSKGGLKLEKAINEFNIDLSNKIMCDIGSSTGGFSDVALQNNIKKIYAIDVGSNQMDKKIRNNKKIVLYENTDFRKIDSNILLDVYIITIDVSFISVTKLLPYIDKLNNVKEIVCLIKPQFECGMEIASKYKGIILNKDIHKDIIERVIKEFNNINYYVNGLTYSPIRGGSGNIEYLLYLTKIDNNYKYDIDNIIRDGFKNKKEI